jgi:hypothetical protein
MTEGRAPKTPGADDKTDRPERYDREANTPESTSPEKSKRKKPRRPGLVIGPTTDDADVQLEW